MKLSTLLLSSVIGLTSIFGGVGVAEAGERTKIDRCEYESVYWNKTWSYDCWATMIRGNGHLTFDVFTNEKSGRVGDPAAPVRRVVLVKTPSQLRGNGMITTDDGTTFMKWAYVNEYDRNWVVVTDHDGNRFYLIVTNKI